MPYRIARDHAVTWLLAIWPIAVGVIIVTFADRFTSHSWRFAAGIPGGYATWAGLLLMCGLLMVFALVSGEHRGAAYLAGLVLVGLWWWVLGGLFIYTSFVDPLANPLGGTVWTPIGLLYWIWAWFEYQRFR